MKLYKYKDYDEYVEIQVAANKQKLHNIYVKRDTIKKIVERHQDVQHILCHGTRNGKEQELFKYFFPDAEIIGTEISDTATDFPNTIQHDFHEVNDKWINKFDIVYSNSWDHSYDPAKSLAAWRDQLNETGMMYIDYSVDHMEGMSRPWDPFEATHNDILELIKQTNLTLVTELDTFMGKRPVYVLSRR